MVKCKKYLVSLLSLALVTSSVSFDMLKVKADTEMVKVKIATEGEGTVSWSNDKDYSIGSNEVFEVDYPVGETLGINIKSNDSSSIDSIIVNDTKVNDVSENSQEYLLNLDIKSETNIKIVFKELDIYSKVMMAYREGRGMESWIVEERQKVAENLGLLEYLDDNSYLSVDYMNKNFVRGEDITDKNLKILIETSSDWEMEEYRDIMRSNISMLAFAAGNEVSVTQKPRIEGAGNGYFLISGASSYGYCGENYKDFWANNTSKKGKIVEFDNADARKVLYYSPDGPEPKYSGTKAKAMDDTTYAIGYTNGESNCANKTRARERIAYLKNYADPLSKGYKAFKVEISDPYQDIIFLAYVPTKGYLNLTKTSTKPEITDGNSCYSLEGAKYGVYASKSGTTVSSKVGELITKSVSGKITSNTLTLDQGTYYLKELEAPKGYALSSEIYTVSVKSNETTTAKVSDRPQNDPINIILGKVDKDTNSNKPVGSLTLEGAEFTVKYFGGEFDDGVNPESLGVNPTRTWVFRTNSEGKIYFTESYKVSGDEFYLNSFGAPVFPLGTITIQETKAPTGYQINDEIFVRKVTSNGDTEGVETYNNPTVLEQIIEFKVIKIQSGTDIRIPGVVFTYTKPDGTMKDLTTDENGEITIVGLEQGIHRIVEKSEADGYIGAFTSVRFMVNADGSVDVLTYLNGTGITYSTDENDNGVLIIGNDIYPYNFKINKINEDGESLDDALFGIYSDKDCTNLITEASTVDGSIIFEGLECDTKYYIKEIKAPKGYRLPINSVYEVYIHSEPVNGVFDIYINGEKHNPKGRSGIDVGVDDYFKNVKTVSFNVVNEKTMKLPVTGSSLIAPLVIGGSLLMILGLIYGKSRREKK